MEFLKLRPRIHTEKHGNNCVKFYFDSCLGGYNCTSHYVPKRVPQNRGLLLVSNVIKNARVFPSVQAIIWNQRKSVKCFKENGKDGRQIVGTWRALFCREVCFYCMIKTA